MMNIGLEGVFVHFKRMDFNVNEFVTINSDGTYSVFINDRISCENQKKAFLHAIGHIFNDDFSNEDVNKIELKAHKL